MDILIKTFTTAWVDDPIFFVCRPNIEVLKQIMADFKRLAKDMPTLEYAIFNFPGQCKFIYNSDCDQGPEELDRVEDVAAIDDNDTYWESEKTGECKLLLFKDSPEIFQFRGYWDDDPTEFLYTKEISLQELEEAIYEYQAR